MMRLLAYVIGIVLGGFGLAILRMAWWWLSAGLNYHD